MKNRSVKQQVLWIRNCSTYSEPMMPLVLSGLAASGRQPSEKWDILSKI